jgi:xylulokinase
VSSEITVGLDIGTTAIKAVAVDGDGTVVARSRVPHVAYSPKPEIFEHDARVAWVDGPRAALDQLGVTDIAGIGISSLMPSFTAVDSDGIPVTPGLLYGDHRGRSTADEPDPLNSREFQAMLAWTAKQAPDAHGYWTAPAVASAALGGTAVVDFGTAFALAPLWNGDWDAAKLGELGIRVDQMPAVAEPAVEAGRIGNAVQVAGVADAWAEATVAGANAAGETLVICGTTLIVWCSTADRPQVPGLWTLPHPLGELQMLAAASNAGGMFIEWMKRALGPATDVPAPGGVPIWVPYLRGERSPFNDPTLRASLHEVDLAQGPGAIMRAAYEATGFVARRVIEMATAPTTRIVASGGGTYNEAWIQALADTTGIPVDVVAVPEGAALGAAWNARVGAGLDVMADATRWAKVGRRHEPHPDWAEACEGRYQRWLTLAGP